MSLKDKIILKGIGGFYYVKTNDEIVECKAKGIFRKKNITPVAGDFVEIERDATAAVISEIKERKNNFVRPPMSNIDNFFIVASTVEPSPSTLVIDKLVATAICKDAKPIIIVTKCDLASEKFLLDTYKNSGVEVILTNIDTKNGFERIRELSKDSISVFCGNSGVGKSTLLSALAGIDLETAQISQKLGRGRHTTRQVELYDFCNGYIADTPGFASLEMDKTANISKEEMQYAFEDVARYIGKCKFADCAHINEIGCAVKDAVNSGDIAQSRYDNYKLLYTQAKEKESVYR